MRVSERLMIQSDGMGTFHFFNDLLDNLIKKFERIRMIPEKVMIQPVQFLMLDTDMVGMNAEELVMKLDFIYKRT